MTFEDRTAREQGEVIAFEAELGYPPEKVWRALTEPALLADWLLPVLGFELEPGTTFRFRADPQPGWDGVVQCRLLEADPPRRLSYTWVVGDIDTVVTFTLEPTEVGTKAGTRLSLEQTGFGADQKRNFGGARYGWRMMGGRLVELLDRMT